MYLKTTILALLSIISTISAGKPSNEPSQLKYDWGNNKTKPPTNQPTELQANAAQKSLGLKVATNDYSLAVTQDADDKDLFSFEIELNRQAWLAIGLGGNGGNKMVGGQAIVYKPGTASPLGEYNLVSTNPAEFTLVQEVNAATFPGLAFENAADKTTLSFKTKVFGNIAVKEDENIIIAYGTDNDFGYHGARTSVLAVKLEEIDADGQTGGVNVPEKVVGDLRVVFHVLLMIISWGILIPFGVLNALLKGPSPQTATWFTNHRFANSLGVLLSTIGIILIIIKKVEEQGNHFGQPHFIIGFIVLLLSVIQVAGGVMRPPKAHGEYEEKSQSRKTWETFHRVLGSTTALLGLVNIIAGAALLFSGSSNVALFGEGSSIPNGVSFALVGALVACDMLGYLYGGYKRSQVIVEDADEIRLKSAGRI